MKKCVLRKTTLKISFIDHFKQQLTTTTQACFTGRNTITENWGNIIDSLAKLFIGSWLAVHFVLLGVCTCCLSRIIALQPALPHVRVFEPSSSCFCQNLINTVLSTFLLPCKDAQRCSACPFPLHCTQKLCLQHSHLRVATNKCGLWACFPNQVIEAFVCILGASMQASLQ